MPEDRGQDLCGTSVLHHPMTIFILGRCRARVIWSGISRSMPHAVIQLSAFLLRCRPYRCNGLLIARSPGRSEFGTVVPSARNRQKKVVEPATRLLPNQKWLVLGRLGSQRQEGLLPCMSGWESLDLLLFAACKYVCHGVGTNENESNKCCHDVGNVVLAWPFMARQARIQNPSASVTRAAFAILSDAEGHRIQFQPGRLFTPS